MVQIQTVLETALLLSRSLSTTEPPLAHHKFLMTNVGGEAQCMLQVQCKPGALLMIIRC